MEFSSTRCQINRKNSGNNFEAIRCLWGRLRNVEQEVCITSNAANNGVEEIEGIKKARRVLEIKMLKTLDFMDGKLDYIHERIDEINENQPENVEDYIHK